MKAEVYRKLRDRVQRSADYWLALTRIEFVGDVTRIMGEDSISRSEVARRMNTSQPYVSKALNGNDNFTIRTMIKFAQALDAVLHVRLTKAGEVVRVLRSSDITGDDLMRVYTPPRGRTEWAKRRAPATPALHRLEDEEAGLSLTLDSKHVSSEFSGSAIVAPLLEVARSTAQTSLSEPAST